MKKVRGIVALLDKVTENMTQTQVGMILMTILIVATVICAILAFTVPALQPLAGHVA